MRSPSISIVMVYYNTEQYIKDAIISVLNQSYKDFEFILIDDGSTDSSFSIANSFKDDRIRFFQNSHDYINSLNVGLNNALGKYIARMDADDIMHPDRLLIQYSLMEDNPDVDFCSSWSTFFGKKMSHTMLYNECSGEIKDPLVSLLRKNIFTHPCMMFKTEFIRAHNLRYQHYSHAEDYKLWVEAAKLRASFYIEPQSLLYYRCHSQQVSSKHKREQEKTSMIIREEIMNYLLKHIPVELKKLFEILCTLESEGYMNSNYKFTVMYQ